VAPCHGNRAGRPTTGFPITVRLEQLFFFA
jgi:hypothetical protein